MFDIQSMLLKIPAILIGLSFHEFAHAYMSDRLGDPTPRNQGRLTLSPRAHLDIIGFIFILIVGFGWAKPVQVSPRYYKNPRRDDMLVSLAGPAMNLLVAILFSVLIKTTTVLGFREILGYSAFSILIALLRYTVLINIMLFVFNLIPIPPLDGYHVLSNFVPYRNREILFKFEQYSTIILIIFIISPLSTYVIGEPVGFIYDALSSIIGI